MVNTERPSALLKRWPSPFSALPSGTEKMLAGYSTVVPNSGTTNVCQSSAGWWLRIWASAPETADNAASVPASRYLATAYMVRPPYDCAGRARRLRCQRLGSTYVSCGGADAAPGRRPARQTRLLYLAGAAGGTGMSSPWRCRDTQHECDLPHAGGHQRWPNVSGVSRAGRI